jgi:hypothetical protein
MARHRKFNVDRFLDRLQGHEDVLRTFVGGWDGRTRLDARRVDVPVFKDFLVNGQADGKDDLVECLYRVYDLCTEQGHEHLVAACRELGYEPDPEGRLPVECLSLKVLAENEEAFSLAYDRHTLWNAEKFSIYMGSKPCKVANLPRAVKRFAAKLAECFRGDKKSDRVLVRHYCEGPYVNFIVYHEKRTKSELVFEGTRSRQRVTPTIFRPAQQDFISYNHDVGQVEIEARDHEQERLRKCFAECCLGDEDFFDGPGADERLKLSRIAEEDFEMPVDDGHSAALLELGFRLKQKHGPVFTVRSKDTLETLDLNHLRRRLEGAEIRRAVLKIVFPDDGRGKRIELSGENKVKFKRATHAEDVFRYLRTWGIAVG